MFQKLRHFINNYRQDYLSKKRKIQLSKEINHSEVTHLKPTIQCNTEWYGNSYGGFYIHPDILNADSIVYSFGIGKDISFDKACIKHHQCKVFGFDPTPKSINFVENHVTNPNFIFHDFGIGTTSKTETFFLPKNPKGTSGSIISSEVVDDTNSIEVHLKSLKDIVTILNHTHIDVLKMDIEGAEYDVLANILNSDIQITQILIEFHDRLFDKEEVQSKEIVKQIQEKGYKVFASSISFEEVSFIHQSALSN